MEKLDKAVAEELDRYLKDGPSAKELADAQKAWLQEQKVRWTNDGSVATRILLGLSTGRSFTFYSEVEKKAAALTPEQVRAAFTRHVEPKRLVIIRAGDLKK